MAMGSRRCTNGCLECVGFLAHEYRNLAILNVLGEIPAEIAAAGEVLRSLSLKDAKGEAFLVVGSWM